MDVEAIGTALALEGRRGHEYGTGVCTYAQSIVDLKYTVIQFKMGA